MEHVEYGIWNIVGAVPGAVAVILHIIPAAVGSCIIPPPLTRIILKHKHGSMNINEYEYKI